MMRAMIDPITAKRLARQQGGDDMQLREQLGGSMNPNARFGTGGGGQQSQQQLQQQSTGGESTPGSQYDLGGFLQTIMSGAQTPQYGSPDISGLSAGGSIAIGPDGSVNITNPNQSQLGQAWMQSQANMYGSDAAARANMFGSAAGLAGNMIGAGAQRDVAQIQADAARDTESIRTAGDLDVANVQATLQRDLEESRRAGLIDENEYKIRLANINNESQQRIAETQAQPQLLQAQNQMARFSQIMETMGPFFEQMLQQMGGGGGIGYQQDAGQLVDAAQAANAQAVAAQNRTGSNAGSPGNDAAGRAAAQQLASLDARAAADIPRQVGQQNFENRLAAMGAGTQARNPLFALLGQFS